MTVSRCSFIGASSGCELGAADSTGMVWGGQGCLAPVRCDLCWGSSRRYKVLVPPEVPSTGCRLAPTMTPTMTPIFTDCKLFVLQVVVGLIRNVLMYLEVLHR